MTASVALAQLADRLGFTRYWFAEHHNMQSVASTTPPVLIASVAAAAELDFHMNPMARALPTGRSHTLALIVAD
ncbi:LLM class flavin-dependent oxidoreductase, partial [Rhizobium johnstonii]|uniref:LLM class flavin-dependent oxidoreductase n=1 Tax=Rhizobium johnstonii TaxID=3019933 RepID=UPI003F9D3538